MNVEIGGMAKELLLQSLSSSKVLMNPLGMQLFQNPRFSVLPDRKRLSIACLTVGEFGFHEGATYAQVVRAAEKLGHMECPLELGPHLRLAFLDQEEGSKGIVSTPNTAPPGALTVASAPLDEDTSTPKGFYLRRIDGVPWLRGYTSWEGHIWRPADAFIFATVPG